MPDQHAAQPPPEPESPARPARPGSTGGPGGTGGLVDGAGGRLVFGDEADWVPPEPPEAEPAGCCPDPDAGPPDGEDAWLADLASGQLDALAAELAAARPAAAESVGAGFTHRVAAAGSAAGEPGWEPPYSGPRSAGPAAGFAAGGPLDLAPAGLVLAQF